MTTTRHDPRLPTEHPAAGAVRRISWGGILAGLFAIIPLQILLSVLGLAIGFWDFEPASDRDSFGTLTMSAGIWWLVSGTLVMFVGGWVAGRSAGFPGPRDGAVHGFVAWGVATVFSLWLAGSAIGGVLTASASALNQAVQATASAMGGGGGDSDGGSQSRPQRQDGSDGGLAQLGIDFDALGEQFAQILRDTDSAALQPENLQKSLDSVAETARRAGRDALTHPDSAQQQVERVLDAFLAQYRDVREAVDRKAVVNAITKNTELSEQEANATVDRWQNQYQQAKSELQKQLDKLPSDMGELRQEVAAGVRQAQRAMLEGTEEAAEALSTASWWVFFTLLAGIVAATLGGVVGSPGATLAEERTRHGA